MSNGIGGVSQGRTRTITRICRVLVHSLVPALRKASPGFMEAFSTCHSSLPTRNCTHDTQCRLPDLQQYSGFTPL